MLNPQMEYEVIVVGGGPAGVSCAYSLAKLGKSVVILDKKKKKKIGDKTCGDALNTSSPYKLYEEFDLPMPHGKEISDKINKISVKTSSAKITINAPGYTVDRLIYGQRLLKNCEDIGVEVIGNAPVVDLFIENDYVCGVKYIDRNHNKEKIVRAPLVADCSGTIGAVRKKLPDKISEGIHQKIPDHHLAASYREIVTTSKNHPFTKEIVLSYVPEIPPPGYIWFFSKGANKLNIGTGWLKTENQNFNQGMKAIFRNALDKEYRKGDDYEIEIKGGGQIPMRPPFDSMVFNGGVLVGDAGCLVDPLTAEGHGFALEAGIFAAKAMAIALDNKTFSRESLWQYNLDIMERFGSRNSISYLALKYLRKIGAEGMDYIVRRGIFSQKEVSSIIREEELSISLKSVLLKIIRGFPRIGILLQMKNFVQDIEKIRDVYNSYPRDPSKLSKWRKIRDTILGEEL